MIPGTEITLGERTFSCPPAPFACVRRFNDIFEGRRAPTLLEMADILLAALQRNYPDLTQEELERSCLDVDNFKAAFSLCLRASGAEAVPPGEA